jgi:alkylation response protein AidB-like acyl-CoA dehydrogenase
MHIGDSPEEAAFRAKARAWLEAHATRRATREGERHEDLATHVQRCRQWQAVLAEHGWAGITWPTKHGGRGGSPVEAAIFAEEQAAFDVASGAFAVAIGMVGPTLMAHGTPEQQAAYLGPMLRGEHVWCQLFSEPGAGSDLAALGTRAELDGDTWVVNGQKVWTSLAQFADHGILLARTDPHLPKHQGISYFVVDMHDPGIEVRPLTQITGVAHFNETFLTDVRVPAANMVGRRGDGWRVAQTTLLSERAFIGAGGNTWTVEALIDMARKLGVADHPVVRQDLARAHCRAATLQYLGYRLRTSMSQQRMPGPEALIVKLAYARHWARTMDTAMSVLGAEGLLADGSSPWPTHFMSQFAVRLGGGTDEVQHNIIGERGLGLPREPAVDRDIPWNETVRA